MINSLALIHGSGGENQYEIKSTRLPMKMFRKKQPENCRVVDFVNVVDIEKAREALAPTHAGGGFFEFNPVLGRQEFRSRLSSLITGRAPNPPEVDAVRVADWWAKSVPNAEDVIGVPSETLHKYARTGLIVNGKTLYVPRRRADGQEPEGLNPNEVFIDLEVWAYMAGSKTEAARIMGMVPSGIYKYIAAGAITNGEEIYIPYARSSRQGAAVETISADELTEIKGVYRLKEWARQFPTQAAAADALGVDKPSIGRYLKTEAVVVDGVIYAPRARRKK